jgi:transglutaminase-like putative cysteine protease
MITVRRSFLKNSAGLALASTLPVINFAQGTPAQRQFNPQPGPWRTFEVTTRVDVLKPEGVTRVWLPVPSINTDWQHSPDNAFSSNGRTQMTSDGRYGARMLYAEFGAGQSQPFVEITSRIQTQNRAVNWAARVAVQEDAATLKAWTRPTALIPTDGIVRESSLKATEGARTDVEKVKKIYDWVVANTYREPKVRGCGEGDIKTMLETGNLGGKCADINAILVGMCRSVGIPARDLYGLRLVPSAFGYKELSGNPASLKGAQHCRAEVFLKDHGWVAMDPADVAKVMRLETPDWIKTTDNPVVAPVNKALFGGWEGNWLAWNNAHDVRLPNSKGPTLGFFMYPVAETEEERLDSYSPDAFQYQITAREVTA